MNSLIGQFLVMTTNSQTVSEVEVAFRRQIHGQSIMVYLVLLELFTADSHAVL